MVKNEKWVENNSLDETLFQEVTKRRIYDWEMENGECFIDQNCYIIEPRAFSGWFMHKYPTYSLSLLQRMQENENFCTQDFMEVYEEMLYPELTDEEVESGNKNGVDFDEKMESWRDVFFDDVSEFVNLTYNTKKRFNEALLGLE